MEFVGADADFRPHAELAAVVEPGAGVDHHGRAIDAVGELLGRRQVAGDDGVGVVRAVPIDVVDGFVQRAHDAAGNDRGEIFGRVVLLDGRLGQWNEFARFGIATDFNAARR